jgi:hypothetical protein
MNGEKVVDTVRALQIEAEKLRSLDYEIRTLEAIRQWALDQQPFKAGDRVRLTEAPSIDKGSGWWSSRHFLVAGHEGFARAVRLFPGDASWTVDWEPDEQTWFDRNGDPQPTSRPHVYMLSIDRFEAVNDVEQQVLTN